MIGLICAIVAITIAVIYFVKKYVVFVNIPDEISGRRVSEIDSITIVLAMKRGDKPQITIGDK